jgi:hypothetical protein
MEAGVNWKVLRPDHLIFMCSCTQMILLQNARDQPAFLLVITGKTQ